MVRWIASCLVILITSVASLASAQDFDSTEFEAFTEDAMAASNIPGLAVILFDDKGIFYEKPYGIAGPNKRAVTLDTPFQLGSVSKSFAALVMVQLAAEGQVELDAPIINYLPNFRTRDTDAWHKITIRHILSHRSGISTFDGNQNQNDTYRGTDALNIAIHDLRKTKLVLEPNEELIYSNANYMLAAAVIETVTGMSYEINIDERVFVPLGMTNSYVQVPLRDSVNEATGFRQWFGKPKAYPFIPGRSMMAAGGVTSSANDLAIYIRAVANKDPRIMPAAYAEELITPQGQGTVGHNGYGLGWMLTEIDNQKMVYHAGLNAGFAAQAGFIKGDKRGGLVLTNSSGSLQVDPGVILRKGLGLDSGLSRPNTGQYMTIWGFLATVVILLLSFILSTVRFTAYAQSVDRVNFLRRVLPSAALFALAYALAVIIPKTQGINLNGIKGFSPDIWLCLTISAVVAFIWGLTRLIYPR